MFIIFHVRYVARRICCSGVIEFGIVVLAGLLCLCDTEMCAYILSHSTTGKSNKSKETKECECILIY